MRFHRYLVSTEEWHDLGIAGPFLGSEENWSMLATAYYVCLAPCFFPTSGSSFHNPFLSSGCLSTSSLPTTSLLNLISIFLQTSRVWPSMCCCLYPCATFYYLALTAPQSNVPFKPHETSLPPQNLS